ncbi:hypothetical protein K0M31_010076, partial [Melipona bicolor]
SIVLYSFSILFPTVVSLMEYFMLESSFDSSNVKCSDNQRSNVRTKQKQKTRGLLIKAQGNTATRKDEGARRAILDLLEALIAGAKRRKRRANRLA